MAIRPLRALEAPTSNEPEVVGSDDASISSPQRDQAGRPPHRRLNRFATSLLALGLIGVTVVGSTGCRLSRNACRSLRSRTECIDEFMISYRNRAMAEKAWHCNRNQLCDKRYEREFKDGFIQGYMEVATGGDPCTPLVAPSTYCGWEYQCADGHNAVNAFFQGFPAGVQAADQDGHFRRG